MRINHWLRKLPPSHDCDNSTAVYLHRQCVRPSTFQKEFDQDSERDGKNYVKNQFMTDSSLQFGCCFCLTCMTVLLELRPLLCIVWSDWDTKRTKYRAWLMTLLPSTGQNSRRLPARSHFQCVCDWEDWLLLFPLTSRPLPNVKLFLLIYRLRLTLQLLHNVGFVGIARKLATLGKPVHVNRMASQQVCRHEDDKLKFKIGRLLLLFCGFEWKHCCRCVSCQTF